MQPKKPKELRVNFNNIPEDFKDLEQFVLWKNVYNPKTGKWGKVPHQPNGRYAKSNDPSTWSSFKDCRKTYEAEGYSGIGFCFAEGMEIVGIDLDQCFDILGDIEPWAQEIVDKFDGAFIEYSPSKRGIHIWCLGKKIGSRTSKRMPNPDKPKDEGIEVYDSTSTRYLTLTGVPVNA